MRLHRFENSPGDRSLLKRVIWVLWTLCAASCLFLSAAVLLREQQYQDRQLYSGEIRPVRLSTAITLPPGIPLASILVVEGQHVVQGQTIAVLDRTVIDHRLDEVSRDIFVTSALRRCLLDQSLSKTVPKPPSAQDAETTLQLQEALEDCRVSHRENALALRRLQDARDQLRHRLARHDARTQTALSSSETDAKRQSRQIILSMEGDRLAAKIARLELEISAVATRHSRDMLNRGKSLAMQVSELRLHHSVLQGFAQSPRLQAPTDGHVMRVRALPEGHEFQSHETIATLSSTTSTRSHASFDIPSHNEAGLRIGDSVQVHVRGLSHENMLLAAHIVASEDPLIGAAEPGFTRLAVALDETAQATLDELFTAMPATGNSARIQIGVELPQKSMASMMLRAVPWLRTPFDTLFPSSQKEQQTDQAGRQTL